MQIVSMNSSLWIANRWTERYDNFPTKFDVKFTSMWISLYLSYPINSEHPTLIFSENFQEFGLA